MNLRSLAEHEAYQEAERLKHEEELASARKILEANPEFASVKTQIHDRDQEAEQRCPEDTTDRFTEPRMVRLLEKFDIRGEAYLRLVTNLESQNAYQILLFEVCRQTWLHFSGFPLDMVPFPRPGAKKNEHQLLVERILNRSRYWEAEGYRQLASQKPTGQSSDTQSTLAHRLDATVARLDITHDELARRIGISKTTYFAVKNGSGKRSTRLKVEQYVCKLDKSEQI